MKTFLSSILTVVSIAAVAHAADAPKPLKVLLITGGCCHDYKAQKDILKKGIEARANVVVDQIHTDDKSTKPPLAILGNPDYAKGYDLVLHDECAADIKEPAQIAAVLKPHRDGLPGVNLHCAMHSYRFGDFGKPVAAGADNASWYEYLGLQTTSHGPQEPIAISYVNKESPITKGLDDWTTIKEELYNNVQVGATAQALARGKQIVKNKKKQADGTETIEEKAVETVVVWTNNYTNNHGEKTRVFSTTIGHNNATVEDARYLDLLTLGVLWACDKLDADGKAKAGYGPAGK
jgi:hypothetical protein